MSQIQTLKTQILDKVRSDSFLEKLVKVAVDIYQQWQVALYAWNKHIEDDVKLPNYIHESLDKLSDDLHKIFVIMNELIGMRIKELTKLPVIHAYENKEMNKLHIEWQYDELDENCIDIDVVDENDETIDSIIICG